MQNWQNYSGNNDDLVISSRIRFARNVVDKSFPDRLDEDSAKQEIEKIEKAVYTSAYMKEKYKSVRLWEQDDNLIINYFERHLISPKLMNNKNKGAFILGEDDTVSIMLNEEDHIRLQCISGGLNLREAFDTANKLDDLIEENVEYAFDEKLGYITACPSNIGTGLRASVMIHLPALTMNDEINNILKALTQVGMTIRGLYGEGSKALSNVYQISNQMTLGITEEDIVSNLEAVIRGIISEENAAREKYFEKYKYVLEDRIYRSLGILERAVLLNLNESMDLISNVRMGVEMGILKDINKSSLTKLLVETHPATMQIRYDTKMDEIQQNINRARLIKDLLTKKDK